MCATCAICEQSLSVYLLEGFASEWAWQEINCQRWVATQQSRVNLFAVFIVFHL